MPTPKPIRELHAAKAFPRNPRPRYGPPSVAEIAVALWIWQTHIFAAHRQCAADTCDERWPCRPYWYAKWILERAALFDVDGKLRGSWPSFVRPPAT